eukprot:m.441177 g.441177  ORF g.441177 m.441177 type:complete len:147 (+) comp18626_c0_seq1:257-697(+)
MTMHQRSVFQRTNIVNPDTGPTPEGYNRELRSQALFALLMAGLGLVCGWPAVGLLGGAAAFATVQGGTKYSIKNVGAGMLSGSTVAASIVGMFLQWSVRMIDANRAYTLHVLMAIAANGVCFITGALVLFFVFLAYNNPPGPNANR